MDINFTEKVVKVGRSILDGADEVTEQEKWERLNRQAGYRNDL